MDEPKGLCEVLERLVTVLEWAETNKKRVTVEEEAQKRLLEAWGKKTNKQELLTTPPLKCSCKANDHTLILKRLMTLPFAEGTVSDTLRDEVVTEIVEKAPELIAHKDERGQTALHLALLQENGKKSRYDLVTAMIEQIMILRENNEIALDRPTSFLASGSTFNGTKMEAGTILGVAALSTSKHKLKVFDKLMNAGFKLTQRTKDYQDNILHSIVRHRHRNQEEDVHKSTMRIIQKFIFPSEIDGNSDTYHMLTEENKAGLTPVVQAALYGDFEMYQCFMTTKAMRTTVCSDGLMDVKTYDITDIETFPLPKPKKEENQPKPLREDSDKTSHKSVLEFVGHVQNQNMANDFVNFPPIKEVIKCKWRYYRKWHWAWFIFHLLSTAILCATAYYRAKFLSNGTPCLACSTVNGIHEAAFALTVCEILIGIIYLFPVCCEIVEVTYKKRYTVTPSFSHAYSNVLFRILYILFGPLLVLDAGFALGDVDVPILPFALIIACYAFLYFFQVIFVFSAFTVIIQKVIPDMLRFAFVMMTLLSGFSMAMFTVMHGADPNDDSFDTFEKSIIKMVSIMIGLGEIDNFFTSRYPGVAIFIFILFVLLTTILLLNSLIAVMSNTCSIVTTAQRGGNSVYYEHCTLQKLSVILYLEHVLIFDCFRYEVGEIKEPHFMSGRRRFKKIETASEVTTESEASASTSFATQIHGIFTPWNTARHNQRKHHVKPASDTLAPPTFRVSPRKTLEITEQEGMRCSKCGSKRIIFTAEIPETVLA